MRLLRHLVLSIAFCVIVGVVYYIGGWFFVQHQIRQAKTQMLQGRHGIYDMKVTNQRGEVVAMFRGKSAQIPGHVFSEEAAP